MGDDFGYSDIGAFGSEISTPNLDALAKDAEHHDFGSANFGNYHNSMLEEPRKLQSKSAFMNQLNSAIPSKSNPFCVYNLQHHNHHEGGGFGPCFI
jgi:hypothetical protein